MRLTTVLIFCVLITSCRKEKTSWDSNWSAPIVHGSLGIENLVPDENAELNSEGYLSLVYHDTVYSFVLDDLIEIRDTNFAFWVNLAESGDFTVNPSYLSFHSIAADSDYSTIEIKRLIVDEGLATLIVQSPWGGSIHFVTSLLITESNGDTFERIYDLAAGSLASPTIIEDEADMKGFDMDFTGIDGTGVNEVSAVLAISSNETTGSFVVTAADSLKFDIGFKNVVPAYAKGYFGQHSFSDTVGFSLAPMKKITNGIIDIDSVNLAVRVLNGFNMTSSTVVSKISGVNTRTSSTVDLSFPALGSTINLNPGSGNTNGVTSFSEYLVDINTGNSNIADFLENLSDSIEFGYAVNVNPDGNISGGNNEFYPDSELALYLDAEFPMNFSANNLTLVDTFDISYSANESLTPDNGEVILDYVNSFPLGATAQFYLLDEEGNIIDSLTSTSSILSGTYNSGTFETSNSSGSVAYSVLASAIENLQFADKIKFVISFTSDGGGSPVKIGADATFDFNLRTNLQIRLEQ